MNPLRYRRWAPVAAALLAVILAAPASAQSDERAVAVVVTHFFDGMRTRDTTLMRSTVTPSAVLISVSGPTGLGEPTTIDAFIDRIGKGSGPGNDEQIKDPKVQIDGPLASLWAYYTLKRAGETKVNHCGVDAFLLRKGPDGWRIFHVADTRRTEGCVPIAK
jgi:ketosteroid isomerase-like protein